MSTSLSSLSPLQPPSASSFSDKPLKASSSIQNSESVSVQLSQITVRFCNTLHVYSPVPFTHVVKRNQQGTCHTFYTPEPWFPHFAIMVIVAMMHFSPLIIFSCFSSSVMPSLSYFLWTPFLVILPIVYNSATHYFQTFISITFNVNSRAVKIYEHKRWTSGLNKCIKIVPLNEIIQFRIHSFSSSDSKLEEVLHYNVQIVTTSGIIDVYTCPADITKALDVMNSILYKLHSQKLIQCSMGDFLLPRLNNDTTNRCNETTLHIDSQFTQQTVDLSPNQNVSVYTKGTEGRRPDHVVYRRSPNAGEQSKISKTFTVFTIFVMCATSCFFLSYSFKSPVFFFPITLHSVIVLYRCFFRSLPERLVFGNGVKKSTIVKILMQYGLKTVYFNLDEVDLFYIRISGKYKTEAVEDEAEMEEEGVKVSRKQRSKLANSVFQLTYRKRGQIDQCGIGEFSVGEIIAIMQRIRQISPDHFIDRNG